MRKEARQIVRDPSSIAIGVVMPLILILLFGFGLSLDVKNVPVAVVMEDPSPEAHRAAAGFQLSPYFHAQVVRDLPAGAGADAARKVDGIVRIPSDFARRVQPATPQVQLIVHGADANRARIIQGYAQGALGAWSARQAAQGQAGRCARPVRRCRRGCGSTRPTTAATSWCPGCSCWS